MPKWLRWLAVFPGALISAVLVLFPLHLFLYLAFAHGGTFLIFDLPDGANVVIEHAVYPAVIAAALVIAGGAIAPSHRLQTAWVLAGLYVCFSIGALLYARHAGWELSLTARSAGALGGLAFGVYHVWHKSKSAH